jgi:hypothetical protein
MIFCPVQLLCPVFKGMARPLAGNGPACTFFVFCTVLTVANEKKRGQPVEKTEVFS